jgi:hypothetical protein
MMEGQQSGFWHVCTKQYQSVADDFMGMKKSTAVVGRLAIAGQLWWVLSAVLVLLLLVGTPERRLPSPHSCRNQHRVLCLLT